MGTIPESSEIQTDAPILAMEGLCKNYWLGEVELQVLRSIDLIVGKGEYAAIMGPSGCGKSTLLNLIGCLDRLTSGRYFFSGQDVSLLDDDQLSLIRGRHIGFIFQSFNLIDQFNVIENIEMPMYYQGFSEHISAERAVKLAGMVGLGDRQEHRPYQLSGGQQQRVAIARALANDPLVILADEPTGNLDSASGKEILNILDDLHRQGKTIIVVTHDTEIAARTQRVIYMLDGRIKQDAYREG